MFVVIFFVVVVETEGFKQQSIMLCVCRRVCGGMKYRNVVRKWVYGELIWVWRSGGGVGIVCVDLMKDEVPVA